MCRLPTWVFFTALVFSALAQENILPAAIKIPLIGILGYDTDDRLIQVFRQGMREVGRLEGKDFKIECRAGEGHVDQLPQRVAELLRLKVDIILASGTAAVRAAQQATGTIPIVMVGIGVDPVQAGLVRSLSHPGGNVTGLTALGADLWGKRIQLFQEMVPKLSQVVFLSNPANPGNVLTAKAFGLAAKEAGLKVRFVTAKDPEELQQAFAEIGQKPAEGFVCAWDPLLLSHSREIGDLAMRLRLPTLMPIREYVEEGALLSYGTKISIQWLRAAWYIDRILKGAKPAELPVEQPMTLELVVNQKTAKALGITIPPVILMLADKVIE